MNWARALKLEIINHFRVQHAHLTDHHFPVADNQIAASFFQEHRVGTFAESVLSDLEQFHDSVDQTDYVFKAAVGVVVCRGYFSDVLGADFVFRCGDHDVLDFEYL